MQDADGCELMRCGLTHNEAKIYLTCLQLGQTPASQIIERSSVPRGTVYDLLNALEKMGLVTSCRINKRLHFTPNNPECLMSDVEERRDAIAKLLPALKQARGAVTNDLSVQTLEGNAAIRKLLDELLAQSGELLVIGNLQSALTIVEYPVEQFASYRLKSQIKMRQVTGRTMWSSITSTVAERFASLRVGSGHEVSAARAADKADQDLKPTPKQNQCGESTTVQTETKRTLWSKLTSWF